MLLVMALLGAAAAGAGPARKADYDLVIAGGRVVDGTGAPWFRADVGVVGDRIAAVGDLSGARAKRRIEAKGQVVAPGFIDMLGQSELNLLVDNRAESKIRQGITSEVTGEGGSVAPLNAEMTADYAPWIQKYGVKVDWTDFTGYFARLRAARPAINLGTFVGAAQVREYVLGKGDVQPSPAQLDRMVALVDAAMEQGALGLSTSLIYPPGSYARTPELVALARAAARRGGIYATHIRDEGAKQMEALEEAFTIAPRGRDPGRDLAPEGGGTPQLGTHGRRGGPRSSAPARRASTSPPTCTPTWPAATASTTRCRSGPTTAACRRCWSASATPSCARASSGRSAKARAGNGTAGGAGRRRTSSSSR